MNNKNNKGFNLLAVILIMITTSIISAITVGIIITNSSNNKEGLTYGKLIKDDSLQEFLRVYETVTNEYYDDIDKEKMLESAMNAMLNYLDDNYTTYMSKEEREALAERLEGVYRGIGITIQNQTIIELNPEGPAYNSGLMVGDIIIGVDNETFEVNEETSSVVSDLIVKAIKNTDKDKVTIKVKRNEDILNYEIKIENIVINNVTSSLIEDTKIGYIGISIFSNNIGEQFNDALNSLKDLGMEQLIIDVRNNTGGYLDGAKDIASAILPKGKLIFSLKNKDTKEDYVDETTEALDIPVVVLINGASASSSEILVAALKDSYNATVIGTTSYGKGKVQQTYTLEDGSMAKYTTALWLRPNGDCIDGKGIIPDIEVPLETQIDSNGEEINVDNSLPKAIEYIQGQN